MCKKILWVPAKDNLEMMLKPETMKTRDEAMEGLRMLCKMASDKMTDQEIEASLHAVTEYLTQAANDCYDRGMRDGIKFGAEEAMKQMAAQAEQAEQTE